MIKIKIFKKLLENIYLIVFDIISLIEIDDHTLEYGINMIS